MNVEQAYESFNEFLIALIHTILYVENVYPSHTFNLVRQYDVAVHQNVHPGVQEWVEHSATVLTDTVRSTQTQSVSFIISQVQPVSKYVLDTSRLPRSGEISCDAAKLFAEYKACLTCMLSTERASGPSTISIAINAEPTEKLFAPESAYIVADSRAAGQWATTAGGVEPIRFIDGGEFCINVWRQAQ